MNVILSLAVVTMVLGVAWAAPAAEPAAPSEAWCGGTARAGNRRRNARTWRGFDATPPMKTIGGASAPRIRG